MRIVRSKISFLFLLAASVPALAGDCIAFNDAPNNVGKTTCVTGKVLKITSSARSGTQFLNFCDDYKKCAFSVVIFPRDLQNVGDVHALEGKTIEIHGKIKEYRGQAEMVLDDARQLTGDATKLPPLPANYDVENQGKYSPGQFGKPKKTKTGSKNKVNQPTAESHPPPPN